MTPLQTIGVRVGARRTILGMTQPELARQAKVGLWTVQRLEHGKRGGATLKSVLRVARALRLRMDRLVKGVEL